MGHSEGRDRDLKKASGITDSNTDAHDLWHIEPVPSMLLDSPLDFLLSSHSRIRQASALLMMVAAGEFDRQVVEELVEFLNGPLLDHLDDEEQGFFPLLCSSCPVEDDIRSLTDRMVEEHVQHKRLCVIIVDILKSLLLGGAISPKGAKEIRFFAEDLRQHLAFENSVLLPISRVRLSSESLETLSNKLKERRHLKSKGG